MGARTASGKVQASGVLHARVIAGALATILDRATLDPRPDARSEPTVEGAGARLAASDGGGETDKLECGGGGSEKLETRDAAGAGQGGDRKRALLVAKAQLNPTGLALHNSQGLWTVAKKTSVGHACLGSVKGWDDAAESSPLPVPSFSCLHNGA